MTPLATTLHALGATLLLRLFAPAPVPPAYQHLAARFDTAAVALAAEAEALPAAVREPVAKALFVMGRYESGLQANPKGDNDKGAACGILQIHTPERWLPGATCAAVRGDLRLGFRVGVALVADLGQKCGNLAAGLTAFATNGQCHGTWVLPEITRRCKEAGVDCAAVVWPKAGTP